MDSSNAVASLNVPVASGPETSTAPSLQVKQRVVRSKYVARSYRRFYISPLKKARRDLAFYRTVYSVSLKRLHPTMWEQFQELESALGAERRDWQKRVRGEHNNTLKALQIFDRLSVHCNNTHDAWQEDRKFWKAKTKSLQRDIHILELTNQSCQNVFSELENILRERIAASTSALQ
ncbi:hypothetical protein F5051DRAFT_445955 [Lentinula edodes]|nr:hypothetical protein F5051DRAFT_445955 [Lentinula edodes]